LITFKDQPHTARTDVIARLAAEIAGWHQSHPGEKLLIGHGSGSFGHIPAREYNTRQGVHSPQDWSGFVAVWREARALNQVVVTALLEAGLPAIAFPPSASLLASGRQVGSWNLAPLKAAIQAELVPLINGDVIFDALQGGTIFSTEDLFAYLADELRPQRVLLAGIEPGVWADYPQCSQLIPEITPHNIAQYLSKLSGSAATDVTGGMASKVLQSLELVRAQPGLQVRIFSGEIPGALSAALADASAGTLIHSG
jgi:isopentenyl phosphate kinase